MESKIITNSKKLRLALIVLSIVLGLIFAVLLGGTVYAEYLLSKVNYVDPDATVPTLSQEEIEVLQQETETLDPDFTGPVIAPEDVVLNTNTEEVVDEQHIINLMLIGQDRRPGQGRQRSDVMILCRNRSSVSRKRKHFTATRAAIPPYLMKKVTTQNCFTVRVFSKKQWQVSSSFLWIPARMASG